MSAFPTAFAQVDDIGVQIIVECVDQSGNVINIAAATSLVIRLGYPDQSTTKDCTAVLYTDGSDGKMVYTTIANDLNQSGIYNVQGKIGFTGGTPTESGAVGYMLVSPNVDNN